MAHHVRTDAAQTLNDLCRKIGFEDHFPESALHPVPALPVGAPRGGVRRGRRGAPAAAPGTRDGRGGQGGGGRPPRAVRGGPPPGGGGGAPFRPPPGGGATRGPPPPGDSGDSVSQTSPRSELSQCWGRMRTTTCSPCSLQAKST